MKRTEKVGTMTWRVQHDSYPLSPLSSPVNMRTASSSSYVWRNISADLRRILNAYTGSRPRRRGIP
ncbi:hypothetical protein BGW80DRAFT_1348755 [Lactifluus volemus]|nr:hypothetical protein BGW80DRAFT_1348755 [Lactifluus volemus]